MVTDIHDGDAGRSMSDLLERDTNAFFNQANTSPCALAFRGGEGSWLEDQDGNRYLDWYGNNCHNLGHAHPSVVAAVEAQLATLAFVPRGFTAEPPVRLAERLAALWPGEAARVSLVPGGAEAVEIALSLARVCTGRSRVISFYTAYHGRSAGALSVSGARHRDPRLGPGVPGTLFVPPFHPVNGMDSPAAAADRSLQAIDDALKLEGDVAALIAEPVRNGPYVPPHGYWEDVRALLVAHGALLIFDEIPVGLGRAGRLFTSEHFGLSPDITVVGKSLGGGVLPLAAVIADERLNCAPDLNLHYYTHEKNPLTAAAGLATLEVLVEEKLPQRAAGLGRTLLRRLERAAAACNAIVDVRGIGLMFGFSFVSPESAAGFVEAARREGVIANGPNGDAVTLAPALNATEDDLEFGLDAVERVLAAMA